MLFVGIHFHHLHHHRVKGRAHGVQLLHRAPHRRRVQKPLVRIKEDDPVPGRRIQRKIPCCRKIILPDVIQDLRPRLRRYLSGNVL